VTNGFFNHTNTVTDHTLARGSDINNIADSVEAGFDKLPTEAELKANTDYAPSDTGAADAYVVSLTYAPSAYAAGMKVMFKPANTSTGASTINVNSLGAVAIKQYDGTAIEAGDITAGRMVELRHDGTNFVLNAPTDAAANATAAAASASAASTSETNAASSASAASTSETNAGTSETNAAASASAASTSASNASTSETNAGTSASNASTSETNAGTSETNAAASAAAASTSETNAAASASAASTSETNASTSETNAAASASAASTSASNASTSETNAAASESAAATSASAAEAAAASVFWNFDSTTTMADPGTGDIRLNHATIASVTQIAVSANSASTGNPDVSDFVTVWDDSNNATAKGYIVMREAGAPDTVCVFAVSGTITDNTTWLQIPVTHISSSGTLTAGDDLYCSFSRSGDDGAGSGDLLAVNNLSDVSNAATSRSNLAAAGTGVSNTFTNIQTIEIGGGSGTAANTSMDDLVIDSNGSAVGINILGGLNNIGYLGWGDNASAIGGYQQYSHATNEHMWAAGGSARMRLATGMWMEGATGTDQGAGTINATGVYVNGTELSTNPAPAQNLIINGAMQVGQRGTVGGLTGGGYGGADRFPTATSGHGTWQLSNDTDAPTGYGLIKCQNATCASGGGSPAAGDLQAMNYRFEGQDIQSIKKGTANAEQVTLQFWVRSTQTGTAIVELYDSDNSRHVAASYTIDVANTWEQKNVTFPADTTGTFDNDTASSMTIVWWMDAGTTYTGGTLATTWASVVNGNRAAGLTLACGRNTNDNFKLTGVGLYVGDTAPSSFVAAGGGSYGAELALCHRYFWKYTSDTSNETIATGVWDSSTVFLPVVNYPVMMRTDAPTLASSGTWQVRHNSSNRSVSAISTSGRTTNTTFALSVTSSSGVGGECGNLMSTSGATLSFSSEL